eukprot:jgi/Tetstr1/453905/TSEL_040824.t1
MNTCIERPLRINRVMCFSEDNLASYYETAEGIVMSAGVAVNDEYINQDGFVPLGLTPCHQPAVFCDGVGTHLGITLLKAAIELGFEICLQVPHLSRILQGEDTPNNGLMKDVYGNMDYNSTSTQFMRALTSHFTVTDQQAIMTMARAKAAEKRQKQGEKYATAAQKESKTRRLVAENISHGDDLLIDISARGEAAVPGFAIKQPEALLRIRHSTGRRAAVNATHGVAEFPALVVEAAPGGE